MIVVSLAMLIIVAAAVLVVTYFAYPQRGRPVPHAPRLGEALERAADRIGLNDHQSRHRPRAGTKS